MKMQKPPKFDESTSGNKEKDAELYSPMFQTVQPEYNEVSIDQKVVSGASVKNK